MTQETVHADLADILSFSTLDFFPSKEKTRYRRALCWIISVSEVTLRTREKLVRGSGL